MPLWIWAQVQELLPASQTSSGAAWGGGTRGCASSCAVGAGNYDLVWWVFSGWPLLLPCSPAAVVCKEVVKRLLHNHKCLVCRCIATGPSNLLHLQILCTSLATHARATNERKNERTMDCCSLYAIGGHTRTKYDGCWQSDAQQQAQQKGSACNLKHS